MAKQQAWVANDKVFKRSKQGWKETKFTRSGSVLMEREMPSSPDYLAAGDPPKTVGNSPTIDPAERAKQEAAEAKEAEKAKADAAKKAEAEEKAKAKEAAAKEKAAAKEGAGNDS